MHLFHLAPNTPETYLGVVSDMAEAQSRAALHAAGTALPAATPIPPNRRGKAVWFRVDSDSNREADYVAIEPREAVVTIDQVQLPKVVTSAPGHTKQVRGWKARNSIAAIK